MVDIDVVEQLVNSLDEAITRSEAAARSQDAVYNHKLRVFMFSVYQKIDEQLGGKHV